MTSLADIKGIRPGDAEKLQVQGINSTEALLEAASTRESREGLAAITGISEKLILLWTNKADLFRIRGVAGQYSELLEAAGVDTVVELSKRRADNLASKLAEVNEEYKFVNQLPSETQVARWIEEAKALPRAVTY
jgi:predicted RecB family nuclease